MNNSPIGVFDSGVGGLSVLSSCEENFPDENFIYVFDKSYAPYGNKSGRFILARARFIVDFLIKKGCKAVVIACNTATSVAIDELRKEFSVPIIGVEPPVKQAVAENNGGKILVLLTVATAKQDRFNRLVRKYGNDKLIIAPQKSLATLIEENFDEIGNVRADLYEILNEFPCVESVVLGCTHYYFLRGMIKEYYGDKIKIYDANEGVVRRINAVLFENNLVSDERKNPTEFIYT